MALKLRATRPPAQGCGTKSVPRQGHNTPLPLKRSPPVSFKRLLGGWPRSPQAFDIWALGRSALVTEVRQVPHQFACGDVRRNEDVRRAAALPVIAGFEGSPLGAMPLNNDTATKDVKFHGGGAAASRLTDR